MPESEELRECIICHDLFNEESIREHLVSHNPSASWFDDDVVESFFKANVWADKEE